MNFRTAKLYLTLSALFSLFFVACSTERIEPKNDLVEYESAEDYLTSKKSEEQAYEITSEENGPLQAKEGTKIWLSKDILMYPNGDSVHFPYTIKVIELYTPKDMIYYLNSSLSDNTLLTTHGQIRVRAFKDGVELVLRPGKFWVVEVPNTNQKRNMYCYYGNNVDSHVNWQNQFNTIFDSIGGGYRAAAVQMGWISCAKPAIKQTETTIGYTVYSDSVNTSGLTTFVYMPNKDALAQLVNSTTPLLPFGESMKLISIGIKENQLFSFYHQQEINEMNMVEVILTQTTDAQLTSLLDRL